MAKVTVDPSDQTAKTAQALYTAEHRLLCVDSEGNVVTDSELANPQRYKNYTPNYYCLSTSRRPDR